MKNVYKIPYRRVHEAVAVVIAESEVEAIEKVKAGFEEDDEVIFHETEIGENIRVFAEQSK